MGHMLQDAHPHAATVKTRANDQINGATVRRGVRLMNKWPDICNRIAFAFFLLTGPYAALTNDSSIAAQTVILDGKSGIAAILGMLLVSILVAGDAVANAMPGGCGWRIVRRRRVFLYGAGAWLACVASYTPSKFDFSFTGSGWVYWGLAAWGIGLSLIDLYARGWAPRAIQNHT